MNDILIGWRLDGYGARSLTYCDNDSTRSIMRDLAIEIEIALAKGDPIHTIHLEYGQPLEESN